MEKKKQELLSRFDVVMNDFTNQVRDETIKAGLGTISAELIEYLYDRIEPILDELADKIAYKAESWLKSRARKIKMWLKRRIRRPR